MREIKFRAWDVGLKQMIPVFDIQFHDPVTRHIDGISLKPKTAQPTIINKRTVWRQVHEDDAVLMQYTGLKDKNGVEIYEGDILGYSHGKDERFSEFIGSVRWGDCYFIVDGLAGWWTESAKELMSESLQSTTNKSVCEVIGNIYSNPELVK